MAVRRLTGSKPGRARRPRRVKFRSRRGVKSHGGSIFRAHKGYRRGGVVFRAHAPKALKTSRARPSRPWKAPKRAAFRGAGRRNVFPVRKKAAAFKSAGRHGHGFRVRTRAAKFRAARAKRV